MSGGPDGTPLEQRFRRHLTDSGLLRDSRRVLVAVSGGVDSVALLHLLRFAAPGPEIHAAHFDHRMRLSSGGDARWVAGLCRAWDVPLTHARARARPASEAVARDMRYEFLHEAAARVAADAVLTGHHADDQAETLLFRIVRGTGLPGLVGIPARRGILVRPLLPFTRHEIVRYARRVRLGWREDPTNRDLRYARNHIRHVVLPALEAVRPGAAAGLARLASLAEESERAWQDVAASALRDAAISRDDAGFVLARDRLLAYHPHLRARMLRQLLRELGSQPDRTAIGEAVRFAQRGRSGSRIELPGAVRLEREFDRLLLRRARTATGTTAATDRGGSAGRSAETPLEIRAVETGEGTFVVGGQEFTARWSPVAAATGAGSTASFDPASLRFPLVLRAWRAGDRIRLAYGAKKLKKLFAERRIGRERRGQVPVLSDAAGTVVWVVGVARSVGAEPASGPVFTITVTDGESQGRA
jgi:tRNA(Ile)-lysidine synthase